MNGKERAIKLIGCRYLDREEVHWTRSNSQNNKKENPVIGARRNKFHKIGKIIR